MLRTSHAAAVLMLTLSSLMVGCGPTEATVSGAVLVDGQPLEKGEILFEELDKSIAPNAGPITAGKYSLRVQPGAKIVRIRASRAPARPDPLMGYAPLEAMIPAEFNTQSTLRAQIKPGKNEGVDFAVTSIR